MSKDRPDPERRGASRFSERLLAMETSLGRERLAAALERAAGRGPRRAAAQALFKELNGPAGAGAEGLDLVRRMLQKGLMEKGMAELASLLNARPEEHPTTLLGPAQAVLIRLGWRVESRVERGRGLFTVRREGEKAVLRELELELRNSAGLGPARSIVPSFALHPVQSGRKSALRPEEGGGIEELSSALCFLLEVLQGGAGADEILAQAEAHEGHAGRDLLLRTTYACNQRCRFCFVPLTGRRVDVKSLERELASLAARLGPREPLTISGGEPLADPRLPELLSFARRKGIRRFVIQTNAVLLDRPGLLEKLLSLGTRTFFVSLHSHKPRLYDKLTGSRGFFPKAIKGLSMLLAAKRCGVTVNVVVNAWNYKELPDLMGFLGKLSRDQGRGASSPLEVYFSMMSLAGQEKAPFLAVTLEKTAPYLRRAVERCGREGLKVQPFANESAFPPCLAPDPEAVVSPRKLPQDRVRYAERFTGESASVGRAKAPACRKCPYDSRCLGVPAGYARDFGLGGLRVPERGS